MPLYVVRASDHDAEAVQPPNRDDLLNTGMSPAQVDHEMIRRHELEVIEASFTRWVTIFGFIVCLLLPVSMGLLIYLIWFWIAERKKECDIPMNIWFIVVIINIIYNINFNGKSIHRQVIKLLCRYEALGHRLEPPPRRVRLYHLLISGFVFGWHCLGVHWVRISKTCPDKAPNLYRAMYLFSTFNIVFTLFTTLSTLGLSQMLASLMRRGLLPSAMMTVDRSAPEGTLELQETVTFDPEALGDAAQCPTCLEDFSKEHVIKRTVCGHLFHEDCLAPWLRVNRTCPLCRADLAQGLGDGAPAETIGANIASDEDADVIVVSAPPAQPAQTAAERPATEPPAIQEV